MAATQLFKYRAAVMSVACLKPYSSRRMVTAIGMTMMLKEEPVTMRLLAIVLLVVKYCGMMAKVSVSKISMGIPGKMQK